MQVVDMVYYWARVTPTHPAIIRPQGIVTYAALAQSIEIAADNLARAIPDREKPVAIAIANPLAMVIACLALLRAGFKIAPTNELLLEHLPTIGVETLVYERGGPMLGRGTNILFSDGWISVAPTAVLGKVSPRRHLDGDVYAIFFTSGTTGKPKPVEKTQQAWAQRILHANNILSSSYERALVVPSLSSAYGNNRAMEVLHVGKTVCFAPFGAPSLTLMNTYDIDAIVASPQQALALADIQEKVTRYPLSSLKILKLGGSVITRDGIERLKQNLCRNIVISYSSTEAEAAAMAPFDAIAHVPNAVGYVVPGVEIEIVDHQGAVLPAGSEGFVRLRTPQFLKGASANSAAWFYSGDLGALTEDGVLCIRGRSGDVVNRGGTKLSSTEFESFLRSCAGVTDAGICTHMGDAGFEEVWAGVVLEPSTDLGAFRQQIEANRTFGNNIDKLFVVESIPRNALGKAQPALLKEMLQSIDEETE